MCHLKSGDKGSGAHVREDYSIFDICPLEESASHPLRLARWSRRIHPISMGTGLIEHLSLILAASMQSIDGCEAVSSRVVDVGH